MLARFAALVLLATALSLSTGCRRSSGPRITPASPADDASAAQSPSPSGPALLVDARTTAMEEAYDALIRGDEGAPRKVLDLGADTMIVLDRAVSSNNVNAMLGAVHTLVQVEDPARDDLLLKVLESTVTTLRVEALDALAQKKVTRARGKIVSLLSDGEMEVRATACDALAAVGALGDEGLNALFVRLKDAEDVVRAACSTTFAAAATAKDWQDRVAALLIDKAPASREGALRVLAIWQGPAAFDLVRGRLADEDGGVRASALAAIGHFGTPEAYREVVPHLKDDRLPVRLEAVGALAGLPVDQVKTSVYEALADREPMIRIEATRQLVRAPDDPETYIRLHALLRDEDAGVRAAAAFAVAQLADPRSFKAILDRLTIETDEAVQLELLDALVMGSPMDAIPHLIDMLDKAKGAMRSRVIIHLRTRTLQKLPAESKPWREWYAAKKPATPVAP